VLVPTQAGVSTSWCQAIKQTQLGAAPRHWLLVVSPHSSEGAAIPKDLMSECAAKRQKKAGDDLGGLFEYIDGRQTEYISRLAAAVAIPSVSAEPEHRKDCLRMIKHYQEWMNKLGIENETRDLGKQQLRDGSSIDLPPALVGKLGNHPSKMTVGIYGHLDVQPAKQEDGWKTDPWVLTEIDGKLYGRGSTDDKGPALGWLWVIEAHQALGKELPVNLIFCLEAMEESGSEGLEALLQAEGSSSGYFSGVDCWCISDNNWLGVQKPCVQYGLRGICYFCAEVSGLAADLHSGKFGGAVHEPMTDLIALLGQLVTTQGEVNACSKSHKINASF
jgi:acetylornithine deacetylase/succinyl-diaminopimelate desuccinylase-like protein